MSMTQEFSPGDIFTFSPDHVGVLGPEDPAWMTVAHRGKDRYVLYERISLYSYPSSSDFDGEVIDAAPGDIGMVLEVKGIPHTLWYAVEKNKFITEKYTVYEVMINNTQVCMFAADMCPVKKFTPQESS